MKISKIAKIYADALINDNCDDNLVQLEKVKNVLDTSTDLMDVLKSPAISNEQKMSILEEVFSNEINSEILNFIKILVEKRHINEFGEIIEAFKLNIEVLNNIKRVEIISAIELDDKFKTKITDVLGKKLNKTISPKWLIDEDIIGGLIIKIDDNVIDSSIKTKLSKIKGNL